MTTQMLTKADYQQAISEAIQRRTEALQAITNLTLNDFEDYAVLHHAYSALSALRDARHLKQQIRELFPVACTCKCVDHRKEN